MRDVAELYREMDRLRVDAQTAVEAAATPEAVEEVRRVYLGRRGRLASLFKALPQMPEPERPALGEAFNRLRETVEASVKARMSAVDELARASRPEEQKVDMTLPGRLPTLGRAHVLRCTLEEIVEVFVSMGFEYVEGPEVETEEFNFERLNIPRDHPARDAQDSFYITDDLLLRTQSTAVDARVMRERTPPMRLVTMGRCYRRDIVDATHMPVFHQVDGFMVGEGITFADLKGVLAAFTREMFGPQTRTRFQPGYFPFTEPSAEVAVSFGDGWLELAGCGMFHPYVLEVAGIDPERYTAFAFGGFNERVVMVRYGIPDIRLFWENDLRMLRQF